jgi:hypothetical protein
MALKGKEVAAVLAAMPPQGVTRFRNEADALY